MENPIEILNQLCVIVSNYLGKPMIYMEPNFTLQTKLIVLAILIAISFGITELITRDSTRTRQRSYAHSETQASQVSS